MDRDSEDLFLGKRALDRKLISAAQLKEALSEQARTGADLRLGEVMVTLGMLTPVQLLTLDQEIALAFGSPQPGPDSTLGRILIERGTITPEQLAECVRLQEADLREAGGTLPRLGEVLIRKGYATAEAVSHALAMQEKTILACVVCSKRCNATGFDPARRYVCPSCRGELRPLSSLSQVGVQEETQGVPRSIPLPSEGEPTRPPPPKRILGKYTILREIGRGGMGVVYEALDTSLHRKVALKMLVLNPKADPEINRVDEERFLREARLSAQLPMHPHVVGTYEAGVIEGNRYLAMEFVDGVSMLDWWKDKSVRLRTQVAALRDAALAADHAHEHGVIHRDLKPENILIDKQGQPHITDFGLAKASDRNPKEALTGKGMVVGSPHYMSPEQVQGLRVDRRTDVYSLGVILYEMFTGRRPFEGGSPEEIMLKALKSTAPSPSSVMRSQMNPKLHRSLENVCLKALSKNLRDRYPTAKALAEDLTRWLNGEEVAADIPGRRRRRRQLILIGGISAAAIVLSFALSLLLRPSLDRELARAADLIRQGNDAGAATVYDRILVRWPRCTEAQSGREELRKRRRAGRLLDGQRLIVEGRYAEAYDLFTAILIEDPSERRALEGRDEAKRRIGAEVGSEPKRP